MGRRAHQSTIESLTQRFDKEALLEQVITAREAAELARLGAEEARVAAEDANRAKSMFLATMSHEIRTPMNGVLGMNELLLRTELTTRQRHFADTVQRSGMQLLAIINDVLDFSKVEAGRLELGAVPIDLRQLADDVLGTYVELASRQGIALRSEMDPELAPALLGDPTRLRQILANLLSNALKFTAQGEVLLRVSLVAHEAMHSDMRARAPNNTPGQTLLLHVRDTGIGIAANAQARLFKAFSQADGSTTRRYGGTGLGLAIARELVTLMSGEIWVTSTPGSGSTFHVQVHLPFAPIAPIAPIASAPAAFATQETLQPRNGVGTGNATMARHIEPLIPALHADTRVRGHVLLVEDNEVNRLVASEMLHVLGDVVTEASNGADALKRWQDGNCDIVLMDCQMPDMDGLEATRRIRTSEGARAPRSHTPIVALTANALLVDREACLAAGMDDHLAKPFSLTQLDATIGRWIDSTFRRT